MHQTVGTTYLEEIVHLQKNVVNFDIIVFHCIFKNKYLPSLSCFILL